RPVLAGNRITLGPGQMAVVGYGRYAREENDLGIQDDVRIPKTIRPVDGAVFEAKEKNTIEATVAAPVTGDLRIIFHQRNAAGAITRSWPGGPPKGVSVGKVLRISAEQDGKPVAIEMSYDKVVWSGLSWAAGEIRHSELAPGHPVTIRCASAEKDP